LTQELVLPPHNINAEEGVLGSLLLSGDVYKEIEGMLKPCDFYSERNRRLYGACVSLRGRSAKINQATVAQQVNAARSLAGPAGSIRVVPRGRLCGSCAVGSSQVTPCQGSPRQKLEKSPRPPTSLDRGRTGALG